MSIHIITVTRIITMESSKTTEQEEIRNGSKVFVFVRLRALLKYSKDETIGLAVNTFLLFPLLKTRIIFVTEAAVFDNFKWSWHFVNDTDFHMILQIGTNTRK